MSDPKPVRLPVRIAGWVIVAAVSLAILEIAVRLLGIQPQAGPYDPNVADKVLGMRPLPNLAQKADFPEYSGTIILQTNNLSFYQRKDTAPLPAAGVTRVVVLGDSFTAGASNADENIPGVLEKLLNQAHSSQPVEVLNAGVGRYSPYQCYVRLTHEILPLRPKHVIVAEYVGNDFLDLIRQDDRPYLTERPDGGFDEHPPRFVSMRDPQETPGFMGRSRLFAVFQGLAGAPLRYQFSRVRIMYENLTAFGYGTPEILKYLREVRGLDSQEHGMMLQILNQQVWFDRFPKTLDLAFRVNRHVIELFRDLCRREGIRLTYTVIPSKDMIEPETMTRAFQRIEEKEPRWTAKRIAAFSNQLTDETARASRELGVEFVDLRDGIRKRKTGEAMYYPFDMHMNSVGNRAAAETLAEGLLSVK
jgi:lysophospholipase L1-like esterase